MRQQALRGLAFAYRPGANGESISIETTERDLIFLVLQFMIDPPREEVKPAIAKCKTAGIGVKMITGTTWLLPRPSPQNWDNGVL